ncbi:hypothetical protein E2C01_040350 [Portunus trituberculatus]|uniref:Chitin-binding type-2 domain-containing protein n=2 Tax=Portunus trituberculatus TaxID=210409 RepID=A0A5B7FMB8_PORTR|nr:hypothetical protein [Portunus trituberculatus]
MLASAPIDAVPAYPTAPSEISALCPMPPGPYPLIMSNPADCGSFYICSWSTAFLQFCPKGLHFNPKVQVCDHAGNVHCVKTMTQAPHADNTSSVAASTEAHTEIPTTAPPPSTTTI